MSPARGAAGALRAPDGREVIQPVTRREWHGWLSRNHARGEGVWVAAYRRPTGKARLEYEDLIEEALAFGWIDGRAKTLDDERAMLWLSPRKPKSEWSRSNKERVARLEREGLMTEAGRADVEVAKKNGAWTALDAVEALVIPPDLARALSRNKKAQGYFNAFPPSAKKMILYWIASARREETRRHRIAETVRLAGRTSGRTGSATLRGRSSPTLHDAR